MSGILKPMFAYQGGKTKLASKIYNEITNRVGKDITFMDVCCGGGSVTHWKPMTEYPKPPTGDK